MHPGYGPHVTLRTPGMAHILRTPGMAHMLRTPGMAHTLRTPGMAHMLRTPGMAHVTYPGYSPHVAVASLYGYELKDRFPTLLMFHDLILLISLPSTIREIL